MGDFTWPSSDLDVPDRMLASLGSFWADVYQGSDLVAGLLAARAGLERQTDNDLAELLALLSRLKVPVFHTDEWYRLTLKESARNTSGALLARFDGTRSFGDGLLFDVADDTPWNVWDAPAGLAQAPLALGGVDGTGPCWCHGIDFLHSGDALWFREDPFDQEGVLVREMFDGNEIVDRECDLWLYRGLWDVDAVYTQFGYVLGIRHGSSAAYRDLVNAVFDGLVEGTSRKTLQQAFAALADVPLALADEVVEAVYQDRRGLCVVTGENAYRYHAGSKVLVGPGDRLLPGDPLTDTLLFYELGGSVPDVRALAVGKGFLAGGYYQDLVFENKEVPWVVTPDPSGGPSRVSFEVGGLPGDVDKFWDDVHGAGVAADTPLISLLPAPLTTVNPLAFLARNVFRNNTFVVKLRTDLFGPNAPGLSAAAALRRLVPPQTACIVLAELAYDGDRVAMDGPGDETNPGYEETVLVFLGQNFGEQVSPTLVTETVTCRLIGGQCQ